MTRPNAIRPWCAIACFPGMQRFRVGTVTMPAAAQHHEIIEALQAHAATFLPAGFEIIEPICGSVFFVPEEP